MANKLLSTFLKYSTRLYFGWILVIGLLTLLPGQAIPDFNWDFLSIDKVIHLSMFLGMSFLGILTFTPSPPTSSLLPVTKSAVLAVVYGFLLEYSQTYIPQRSFDYADLVANVSGVAAGTLLYYALKKPLEKHIS